VQSSSQSRTFELIAGHPALDLVNTLDWRFRSEGPEELLESYSDLLCFAKQSGLLNTQATRRLLRKTDEMRASKVLSAVRGLREAAAEVCYASLDGRNVDKVSIARLDELIKAARAQQRLSVNESGLRWEWEATESSLELPLWRLSLSTEELLTSETAGMVRACANPDCRWLFLDTSRNHTRRWCDMKICGNRMKARRFKAQHRLRTPA
jgi:predicted RNA-binding Zn ribbon-like protein